MIVIKNEVATQYKLEFHPKDQTKRYCSNNVSVLLGYTSSFKTQRDVEHFETKFLKPWYHNLYETFKNVFT